MKILILLPKWEGGVGVVVKNLKKELEKRGDEVDIITRQDDLGIHSFLKSVTIIRKLVKQKGKNYDIIYTQDWSTTLPLLFPSHLFKKKHFCCFHGIQPGPAFILQKFVGNLMRDKLIAVGDTVKKEFKKSTLVCNGIQLEIFKPLKKVRRIKNSIGFVNYPKEIWHFNEIKKIAEKTNKKFFNVWDTPYEKMPEFYNKIETFISLPPNYTGYNMCWIEAMACGVPRIIGNNNGVGKGLPITKIEDYYGDIEKAILNAKKRDYRKWILDRDFTWEKSVDKLINVFKGNTG